MIPCAPEVEFVQNFVCHLHFWCKNFVWNLALKIVPLTECFSFQDCITLSSQTEFQTSYVYTLFMYETDSVSTLKVLSKFRDLLFRENILFREEI